MSMAIGNTQQVMVCNDWICSRADACKPGDGENHSLPHSRSELNLNLPNTQPFDSSALQYNSLQSLPDMTVHFRRDRTIIATNIVDQCCYQSLESVSNVSVTNPRNSDWLATFLLFSIGRDSFWLTKFICSDLKMFGNRCFSILMTRLLPRFVATSMFL